MTETNELVSSAFKRTNLTPRSLAELATSNPLSAVRLAARAAIAGSFGASVVLVVAVAE
jgi:hypothetical protein